MFRPKLGQLQALKIQNTLRKTFNEQEAIIMTTRCLAVGSHKNKIEHSTKNNSSGRMEINKMYTDNCTEFTIHEHDGVPHTTQANGVWLIQPDRAKKLNFKYIYRLSLMAMCTYCITENLTPAPRHTGCEVVMYVCMYVCRCYNN